MCLTINPRIHKREGRDFPAPFVTEEDIVVFKSLKWIMALPIDLSPFEDHDGIFEGEISHSHSAIRGANNAEEERQTGELLAACKRIPFSENKFYTPYRNSLITIGQPAPKAIFMALTSNHAKFNDSPLRKDGLYRRDSIEEEVVEVNCGHHALVQVATPAIEPFCLGIHSFSKSEILTSFASGGYLGLSDAEFDTLGKYLCGSIYGEKRILALPFIVLKKAIIPKGTKYFFGADGDIVSETLTVIDGDLRPYLYSTHGGEKVLLRSPNIALKYSREKIDLRDNAFGRVSQNFHTWKKPFSFDAPLNKIITENNLTQSIHYGNKE